MKMYGDRRYSSIVFNLGTANEWSASRSYRFVIEEQSWTGENKKKSIKIVGIPAEIRSEYLLNTSLEHCRYAV
jgi:hypothetical protein